MRDKFIVGFLSLAVLLLLTTGAAMAETTMIDGVPNIRNSNTPANGIQQMQLQELWRIGGDDEDILLGAVGSALMDETGNIYLMDSQLNHILVLSPEGELINTLGGEGDGPGEIRGLAGISFMPDGKLAMIQTFPGRVVTINRDGTPGPTFHFQAADGSVANFGVLVGCRVQGDSFIMSGMTMAMNGPVNTQTYYLSNCDSDGKELHRFYTKTSVIDYSGYIGSELSLDFVWARWSVSSDGLLYAAPERNNYKIDVRQPDGTLVRVIEREYKNYKRNADEMELVRRFVEAVHKNHPVQPTSYQVEEIDSDISSLRVNPNGELWVSPSQGTRNQPEGVCATYDVFTKEGVFDRQVSLFGDFDPNQDLIQFLGKDRCLVIVGAGEGYLSSMGVAGGEEGEEEVPLIEAICYQIK